jgi:hypothetical protein
MQVEDLGPHDRPGRRVVVERGERQFRLRLRPGAEASGGRCSASLNVAW